MSKAAAAFRTISEVADELDVPKHVLRFWELKFPQLKPMKRGGGRRYYRPEDLELLRGIRHLLHADGYTIKGVQKILREQGVDAAKAAPELAQQEASAPKRRGKAKSAGDETTGAKGTSKRGARGGGTAARGRGVALKKPAQLEGLTAKNIKALERAIKELQACRDILRGKPLTVSKRVVPVKARRARASR